MGDSLGEGYFGMSDFMEGIVGDDDARTGLIPSSILNRQGSDVEGREEKNFDVDKAEARDPLTYDGARTSDLGQGDQGMGFMRARGGSFSAHEDPGLIPGDLEHEFLLLKKKKFPGINIVQVFSIQTSIK